MSAMECQENFTSVCLPLKNSESPECSVRGSDESEDWDSDLDKVGSRSASTRSWERGARSGRSASWMDDDERLGDAEAGIHMSLSLIWVGDLGNGLGSIGSGRSRGSFLAVGGEAGGDVFAGGGGGGSATAAGG